MKEEIAVFESHVSPSPTGLANVRLARLRIRRTVRTLKLTIAYDGTAYAGWQFQVDRADRAGYARKGLEKVTGEAVRVLASGRTDAGVHALRQVVRFSTGSSLPPEVLCRALNANLPEDVAVLEVSEAPEGFHPISHVRRRRYRYLIHDGPVRDVSAPLRLALRLRPARRRGDAPGRGRLVGDARLPQLRDRRCAPPNQRADRFRYLRPPGQGRAGGGGRIGDWGLGIGGAWRGTRDCWQCRLRSDRRRPIPTTSLSSRSRPTGSSTTWCGPSSARWSKWAAAAGRKPGRARSSGRPTAAPPAPPPRHKDFSWSG